jgi:hypothetical protein
MLPSSTRLVASSTRASRFASKRPTLSGSSAVAVWSFTCRPFHQRRHSSSKPPSTDGDAKDAPARQAVHPSPSSRSDDTKTSSEKRRRKGKGSGETDSGFEGLPSVPSTKHVSQEGMRNILRLPNLRLTITQLLDYPTSFLCTARYQSRTVYQKR